MASVIKSVLLGVLLCSLFCGCGQSVRRVQQDDEAIWAARKDLESALNSGDAQAVAELFTQDAVLIWPDGQTLEGKEAIHKMHEDFLREYPGVQTEFTRELLRFPARDVAIEDANYVEKRVGQPPFKSGDTTVLVKRNGRWLIDYVRIYTPKMNIEANNTTRRVVTGHDMSGKSVFVLDGSPPRTVMFDTLPGFKIRELWTTEAIHMIPVPKGDPTVGMKSFVPKPGGSRFKLVVFPPGEQGEFDPDAFRREYREKVPGLAETMEEEDLAMHTTDTIDYGVIVRGEIMLELDDGATVTLKAGDCFIQNGTRHAWHNRGTEPCLMAVVLVGAERK